LDKVEARQKWTMGAKVDLQVIADQFTKYLIGKQLEESSIKTYLYAIRFLVEVGARIFDPDVDYAMGQRKWSDGWKNNITKVYTHFVRMQDMEDKWDKPKMNPQKGRPRPPSTEQVITMWSGASRELRCGEPYLLQDYMGMRNMRQRESAQRLFPRRSLAMSLD